MQVYMVFVTWDCHANAWCAVNEELGIVLENASFDKLVAKAKTVAPKLAKLNDLEPVGILHFVAERREGVENAIL